MDPRVRRALGVAAALVLALALFLLQGRTLYSLYFATGWLLLLGLGLDLGWRWQQSTLTPRPSCWLGTHAGLALGLSTLFLLHLELRMPTGWIEGALLVMFLLLLASGIIGVLIRLGLSLGVIDGATHGPRLARRWVLVHVPLEASLVALALVHGVLVHTHGLMAHLMLGK